MKSILAFVIFFLSISASAQVTTCANGTGNSQTSSPAFYTWPGEGVYVSPQNGAYWFYQNARYVYTYCQQADSSDPLRFYESLYVSCTFNLICTEYQYWANGSSSVPTTRYYYYTNLVNHLQAAYGSTYPGFYDPLTSLPWEATGPTPTPSPGSTPTPSPSGTPTPTVTPSPSPYGDNPLPPTDPDGYPITIAGGDIIDSSGIPVTKGDQPQNADNPSCASCPNPVNLATGSMWHAFNDISLIGRTSDSGFNFKRTYLAKTITPNSDFGSHWFHSYQTQILAADYSQYPNLIWIDQQGGAWIFTRNVDHTLNSPAGFFGSLIEYSDRYELVQKRGVTFVFTRNSSVAPVGKLISVKEPHGEHVDLTYSSGKLSSITGAYFGTVNFSRNSLGFVSQVTRVRDSLSYYYTYDTNQNLYTSSDVGGNLTTYNYTNVGGRLLLSLITDPLSRALQFSYNIDGSIAYQIEHGNARRDFTYSVASGNHVTLVHDVDGNYRTYKFNSDLRLIEIDHPNSGVVYQTFNAQGLLATQTNALGNVTSYFYDTRGNLTSVQKPLDTSPTVITYNQTFDTPTKIQKALEADTNLVLNTAGDTTQISRILSSTTINLNLTRNVFGGITTTSNGLASYTSQYNTDGFKTVQFDRYNPETRLYDTRGRLIKSTYLAGRIVQYTYDDFDRVTGVTDSTGPSLTLVYDLAGRLTSKTSSNGTTSLVTSYLYDARDRVTKITNPDGTYTTYQYEGGNSGFDKPLAILDNAGHEKDYGYNVMGDLTSSTDEDGHSTGYAYNVNRELITVTNPGGVTTAYEYDTNGRLLHKTDASVAQVTGVNQVVNQKTDYVYDTQGRISEIRMLSGTTTGQANVIKYFYDTWGRVIEKKQYKANGATILSTQDDSLYTYASILDSDVLLTANNGPAQLTFTGDYAPPYKDLGFRHQSSGVDMTYTFVRNSTGEITSIRDQGNNLIKQTTYDTAGRIVSTNVGSLTATLAYDGFGRKHTVGMSNGMTGTYTYDTGGRVSDISWTSGTTVNAHQVLTYNSVGNISVSGRETYSQTNTYDAASQITGVNFTLIGIPANNLMINRTFTYDVDGNRTNDTLEGSSTYSRDFHLTGNSNNRLADLDGYGQVAQAAGVANGITKKFTYRPDGKMTSFYEYWSGFNDQSANYLYDALGRRVGKAMCYGGTNHSNCSTVTNNTFINFDKDDKILQAKNGAGTMISYLDGQGIDEHFGHSSSVETLAYMTDHLGSVLNSPVAGSLKAYAAFGDSVTATFATVPTRDPAMYGFAGRSFDSESLLYYNRARMYEPRTGRFLSKDPIGLAGGDSNNYRYVVNSPLKYTDPDGEEAIYGNTSSQATLAGAAIGAGLVFGSVISAPLVTVVLVGGSIGYIIGSTINYFSNGGPVQQTFDIATGAVVSGGAVVLGGGSINGLAGQTVISSNVINAGALIGGLAGGAACSK